MRLVAAIKDTDKPKLIDLEDGRYYPIWYKSTGAARKPFLLIETDPSRIADIIRTFICNVR